MTKHLIVDASALRDLRRLRLFYPLSRMGYTLHTTTPALTTAGVTTGFITNVTGDSDTFIIEEITETELSGLIAYRVQHPGITLSDCSVLLKSGNYGYTILTSDPAVVSIASLNNIAVLNYVGLFQIMVHNKLLSIAEATEKYLELTTRVNILADTDPPDAQHIRFHSNGINCKTAG